MKRKILSFVLALAVILPCMFALTACGGFEEGATYKFNSISFEFGSDVTEAQKSAVYSMLADKASATEQDVKDSMKNGRISFKDGKITTWKVDDKGEKLADSEDVSYYTKDGNTIKMYETEAKDGDFQEIKIDGDKLVIKIENEELSASTITLIYKKA